MPSFETTARRLLARIRRENAQGQDVPLEPVGYLDSGENIIRALLGDPDGIYAHAIGRASSTGTAETQVAAGEAQRLLVDLNGKLYTISEPSPTSIQMVEGDIAHDAVDTAGSNPVKIGARATATPAAPFAAVAAGDRSNLASTLTGGLVTVPEGDVANDAVDSGNPIKVGAVARGSILGATTAVAAGDRVDLSADLNGHLQVALAGGNRWTKFNSTLGTPATTFSISAAACILGRLSITADQTADIWALVYDNTSATGDPVDRFLVTSAAGAVPGSAVRDYTTEGGLRLSTGCFVALTTDPGAVTAPGTGGFCHAITQAT